MHVRRRPKQFSSHRRTAAVIESPQQDFFPPALNLFPFQFLLSDWKGRNNSMLPQRRRLPIEYAHILFIDIVGFSKLPTFDQQTQARACLDRAIEASEEFQRD